MLEQLASIVSVLVLFAAGCGAESSDSAPAPKPVDPAVNPAADPAPPPVVEPPKPPAFVWHVAMKLPAGREFDTSRFGRLPLVVSEDAYWLSTNRKLIELKREGAEPPKLLDIGKYTRLIGAHGDELFLVRGDANYKEAIYVMPKAGGEPTKRFDRETMIDPVLVGDRLVVHSWKDGKSFLHHAPVAGGEFTTLELVGSLLDRQPVVRGDAMLLVLDWGKIVRVAGDMTKVETVYEPDANEPSKYIRDVAFVGDSIAFVVGDVDADPTLTLVRQAPDGTRVNLHEVPADSTTSLIGDGERAYFQVRDQGTWLVDAQTVQQVDLGGWTDELSGTPAGLVWRVGSEIRIATAGGAAGPELPSEVFEAESDFSGLGGGMTQISGKSTIVGPVEASIIRRIARAHGPEVRKCHAKGKKSDPNLADSIALSFTINVDGTASDVAAVAGESVPNPDLVACLVTAVGTWKFPKPGRGGLAKVVHTIDFK